MRVISDSALVAFASNHPAAGMPLQAWRRVVESRVHSSFFADLKATFNTVDRVGSFHVFNIGGHKFRIVAAIHFDKQRLYVRHVFTHKEFDSWKP